MGTAAMVQKIVRAASTLAGLCLLIVTLAAENTQTPTLRGFLAAIRSSDVAALKTHLAAGFRGDDLANSNEGTTALMVSMRFSEETTRLLIEAGVKHPNARETWLGLGETALMKALLFQTDAVCECLLECGADPALTNRYGWNALHFAAFAGKERAVKKLIKAGIPPDALAASGLTPLHLAARYGQLEVCRILVAAGANPVRAGPDGWSPRELARVGGFAGSYGFLGGRIDPAIRPSRPTNKDGLSVSTVTREGEDYSTVVLTAGTGTESQVHVEIVPARGGAIASLRVGKNDILKPASVGRLLELTGGIPILFPTPNTVSEGILRINGRAFEMRSPFLPRPLPQHGYARLESFVFESPKLEAGEARLDLVSKMNAGNPNWRAFPFSNNLHLRYALSPKGLRIEYRIENRDRVAIPLGIGFHPYWRTDSDAALGLDKARLREALYSQKGRSLLPLSEVDENLRTFSVSRFFLRAKEESSTLSLGGGKPLIFVTATSDLELLVAYRPDETSFCIEHQSSAPDAHRLLSEGLEVDAGLFRLAPGETRSGEIVYRWSD